MNAVRLERRVWTVLLDQTSLAGVLELGRRETLLVRIGVVLKKRSVSGWRLRRDKAIVSATSRAWVFIVVEWNNRDTARQSSRKSRARPRIPAKIGGR
jgi:hypothetical protein